MASLHEAKVASERAWDTVQSELNVRPSTVGIVRNETGFGLTITLPRMPKKHPPAVLFGVPVEYHVAEGTPSLLGSTSKWRAALHR